MISFFYFLFLTKVEDAVALAMAQIRRANHLKSGTEILTELVHFYVIHAPKDSSPVTLDVHSVLNTLPFMP